LIGNALELGQFELWCLLQVAARDGSVAGVRAAVRWRHPERGILPYQAFAGELAASGMAQVFVLHMVCDALAALRLWQAEGFQLDMVLCLPLLAFSADTPGALALAADIRGLMAQAGMASQRLVLESAELAGCCEVSDLLDWQKAREQCCAHAAGDFIAPPQPIQAMPAALRRWHASYSVMSAADAFS
jgi:EAL domain-containing protein (putative c-di-GMP-specific phosphodiesterase class I)